jgi:hypothetical protein
VSPSKADRFGAVAVARAAPAPAPAVHRPPRKYTLLLAGDVADALDADVLRMQVATGRRVGKAEVVRELVALLHEDPTLLAQVEDRLRGAP